MSDLGAKVGRYRAGANPNNSLLDSVITIGISQKILPESFRRVLGNNTSVGEWQGAYETGVDEGFVFAKAGEPDTNFFQKYWSNTQNQIMNTHGKLWVTKMYQDFEGRSKIVVKQLQQSVPDLLPAFSKIFMYMLRNKVGINDEIKNVIIQTTGLSGLSGGKIADDSKSNTWVKPVVILGVLGAVVGIGYWKKDEIMEAVKGEDDKKPKKQKEEKDDKDESINGVGKAKKRKKGLGKAPNKGLQKMLAINKSAKSLQNQSGYEMRNVKEVEVKTVRKSMPKLSWKEAQKRAKNLYKNR